MNDGVPRAERKRAAQRARDEAAYINATVPHPAAAAASMHQGANLNNQDVRRGKAKRPNQTKRTAGKRKANQKFAKRAGLAWIALLEKQGRAVPGLRAAHTWLKAVSHPFLDEMVRCPISYNPVPSTSSLMARTEFLDLNVTVPAGDTTQYSIFAGHAGAHAGSTMDGTSYHTDVLSAAAHTAPFYSAGPIDVSMNDGGPFTATAIAGTAVGALPLNTYNASFLGPIGWNVALPFLGQEGGASNGGHSRWRLSSMGIEVINTTPVVARGGDIVTVSPTGSLGDVLVSGDNQNKLAKFGSFKVHDVDKPVVLAWVPRPRDLAFWHPDPTPVTGGTANATSVGEAATFIFLNNPTGSLQNYTMRIRANWEIAGTGTKTLQATRVDIPSAAHTIGPAVAVAAEIPAVAPGILEKVSQAVASGMSSVTHVGELAEKAIGAVGGAGAIGGQFARL